MIINIVFLVLTITSSSVFLILLFSSNKYNGYIEPIDAKDFSLKEIYGVGFKLIDMFKMEFRSKSALNLRQEVSILYGDKYVDYFLRVLYAQRFSMTALCFVISCIISCLAQGPDKFLMFGLGVVLTATIYYYYATNATKQIKKRSQRFMSEFPNAISTVALLVNSGMMLRDAWHEVAMSDDTELYLEMRRVTDDMNNGMSEMDALYAFANRSVTPDIKKFTSFIVQGLEKGSKDLAHSLKNQNDELWEAKKQNVLQQGEIASSKLLIPIMIMFIGVLIMVMGPIMTNLGI